MWSLVVNLYTNCLEQIEPWFQVNRSPKYCNYDETKKMIQLQKIILSKLYIARQGA